MRTFSYLAAGLTVAAAVPALFFWHATFGVQPLTLTALDVGQGDAFFIRTPAGQQILVDAGPSGEVVRALDRQTGYFTRRLDFVVLTHPDLDHVGGLPDVLARYRVGQVLLNGTIHETAVYTEILRQLAARRVPVAVAEAAQDYDFGAGVRLDVVSPLTNLAGSDPADSNAASIVARLSYGRTHALLTGDADFAAELALLQTATNLKSQVLKLGHHGSRTSSSPDFLAAVQSQLALVSAGKNNRYGHPTAEVLARVAGQQLLRTDERGTFTLLSDGQTWQLAGG